MIPTHSIGRGGVRIAALETASFAVDETRYPGDLELGAHLHERANFCVVLGGALTERMARRECVCEAGTFIVKPAGEVHSDRFHGDGARCINVSIEHDRLVRIHEGVPVLTGAQFEVDPALLNIGHRISEELFQGDDLSCLAVEGLALELITATVRNARRQIARPPDWIVRVREFLHDNFSKNFGLAEIAAAVGRHPTHVARLFRRRFGVTIGEYVRRIRVERAASRLGSSRESLAKIAVDAGFADQSHMQRVFKARMGVTPAAYRRDHA